MPPDLDPLDLAQRLKLRSSTPIPHTAHPEPLAREQGHVDTFWVLDLNQRQAYQVEAELRYISPHAYWYVQEGIEVSQEVLESAATTFERDIYGPLTEALGTEWAPGVDGDLRMTLLHGAIRGAAGYFSSTDEYPQVVYPYSNEREMMYINVDALEVGSRSYLGVLAHEFQHAIHWRADRTEDTWVNEGLAEVAKALVGYPLSFPTAYLNRPRSSLVHWAQEPSQSVPQYGGASLLVTYLLDHYGGPSAARRLLEEPGDSVAGVDAFLKASGFSATFEDVISDWAVATLLDMASGAYSYPGLDLPPPATSALTVGEVQDFSLDQTGVSYLAFKPREGDVVGFQGSRAAPLVPVRPPDGEACWWSNAGDSIDSMLTRAFDLTGVDAATLELLLWYNLEEGWDYAYVEVSPDGGQTWEVLRGGQASAENPVGTAMGPGYTGKSNGWVWDRVALSPYKGQKVLVRLEYVTDESVNLDGLCLAGVRIPETDYEYRADMGAGEWDAQGFTRIAGPLRQRFSVQVVLTEGENKRVRVRHLALDEDNRGSLRLEDVEGFDRAVVVVVPLTYRTRQPADFTVEVRREG